MRQRGRETGHHREHGGTQRIGWHPPLRFSASSVVNSIRGFLILMLVGVRSAPQDDAMSQEDLNPYQAPLADEPANVLAGDDEQIRRIHLSHEAALRSFGTLFYLGAVVLSVGVIAFLTLAINAQSTTLVLVRLGGIAILQFVAGWSLRGLTTLGRILATILGLLGLLWFPVGTLINGYLLYLLWSPKGAMVFSARYREIMQATPHIRYRTSPLVWFFLVLLVLVVAAAVTLIGV